MTAKKKKPGRPKLPGQKKGKSPTLAFRAPNKPRYEVMAERDGKKVGDWAREVLDRACE